MPGGVAHVQTLGWEWMDISTGWKVATGYHQPGNLTGRQSSQVLRFSVSLQRDFSDSAQSKGVEHKMRVEGREQRTIR